jgi:hypothetical protein
MIPAQLFEYPEVAKMVGPIQRMLGMIGRLAVKEAAGEYKIRVMVVGDITTKALLRKVLNVADEDLSKYTRMWNLVDPETTVHGKTSIEGSDYALESVASRLQITYTSGPVPPFNPRYSKIRPPKVTFDTWEEYERIQTSGLAYQSVLNHRFDHLTGNEKHSGAAVLIPNAKSYDKKHKVYTTYSGVMRSIPGHLQIPKFPQGEELKVWVGSDSSSLTDDPWMATVCKSFQWADPNDISFSVERFEDDDSVVPDLTAVQSLDPSVLDQPLEQLRALVRDGPQNVIAAQCT